jgi:hypothetical protein
MTERQQILFFMLLAAFSQEHLGLSGLLRGMPDESVVEAVLAELKSLMPALERYAKEGSND